jgi:hypothetical protein
LAAQKGKTTTKNFPSFVAVVGSGIRDPRSRMDKNLLCQLAQFFVPFQDFMDTKKSKRKRSFSPSSFSVLVGSVIRDSGQKKNRIRDKHPGSERNTRLKGTT